MDIRDMAWDVRPAGNTLLQQIEAFGEKLKIPMDKRKDLRWLQENLRSLASDEEDTCEYKILLSYVQAAVAQGLDKLSK